MAGTSAKTLGALRQLATLGLPGKIVVPEVMGLLDRLVGFDIWGMRFMDAQLRLMDGLASPDVTPGSQQDFAEHFHNREAGGADGVTVGSVIRRGRVVLSGAFVERRELERTAFWERILRPVGQDLPAQIPLALDGCHPHAVISMSRAIGGRAFTSSEAHLLDQARPWLCHALSCGGTTVSALETETVTGDTGVLIFDVAGRIESASPGAISLLLRAVDDGLAAGPLRLALAGNARGLLRRLGGLVGAKLADGPVALPAVTSRNRHGSFHLRAYALDTFGASPRRMSLHIERHVPAALRPFSAPRFLGLPNRERDVALRLLRGRSYPETAADLGIGQNSVVYYVRSLFRRLDIESREQLLPALLARGK